MMQSVRIRIHSYFAPRLAIIRQTMTIWKVVLNYPQ